MDLEEIILWQLQHQCKQHQQLPHDLKVNVLCKGLNFVPVLLDHGGMLALIPLGKFRRIVYFGVVFDTIFDFADAEGLVAVVAAVFEVGTVFEFFRRGEVEDLFAEGELAVDLLLAEAEVCYVEETWLRVSGSQTCILRCGAEDCGPGSCRYLPILFTASNS